MCEGFLKYFYKKLVDLAARDLRIELLDVESCPLSTLTHITEITLSTLEHTVSLLKSSTCPSDFPNWFFEKEIVFQTNISCCPSSGIFPSNFKQATVYPLSEKPSLGPSVLRNRPISKLPFFIKDFDSRVRKKATETQWNLILQVV